jgi:hypothetical protein
MNFQKTNNITGWIVFTIALAVYWLTMEETASYWDCGEFIAVSYKLQVPHPPGAPLFLLLGRIFSFLALGDVTKVAYWINFISVLSSAFTILFLFWSIVLFGRKLLKITKPEELSNNTLLLMGAGAVGALAYTFSDSFWFSAVEAEVYAMSSFFTAFIVWAMLKWDVIEDEAQANRWLVLIFYMIGLSIGIHRLNLVTLPALGLIFYFKKYKLSIWGVIATLLISGFLILFINDLIIPGLPTIAGNFEIFFVNTLHLPFGSGVIVISLIIIAALTYGILYSQKKQKEVLNTFLLSTAFILIGYSSYALVVIRSNYHTPINENDPKDIMSFVSYLNREQYGSRPLLYGEYFTSQPIGIKEGAPTYKKGKDRYEIQDRSTSYEFNPNEMTILPRIYSRDPDQARRYREILGLREGEKPTFSDNLSFMFSHQIGWMYARYFMWNFAGRDGDEIGAGWISPSSWFEKIPDALSNKARNNYFMIPFVLGLIGMFVQTVNDKKNMAVVGLLFVLTGVALVVYLNGPAAEPRERDYVYVGSFYAYCFWIGFAVIGIAQALASVTKNLKIASIAAILICSAAPAIMAAEGWDDHDRSNRYFSVDSALNYLESCAPNAVIFSGGDNDTFPLWYAQEVEGIRTDMRVIVLSYYNTDWYIEQSMSKHYESEPLPYTLSLYQYRQGGPNDYLPYEERIKGAMDLKDYIDLLSKDYRGLQYNAAANLVPTKDIILNVDVEKVKSMGIIPEDMDSLVVPQMLLRVKGNALEKKDLALLDFLLTNNWERPVYVNNTSLSQFNIDLTPYIVAEGNTYRILPVYNKDRRSRLVNTKVAYENMMKKFQFRGLDDPGAYFTQDYRNFVMNHRGAFNELAEALINKGDKAKAREVILYSLEKMPNKSIQYDVSNARNVEMLFEVGEKEKAIEVANDLGKQMIESAAYYFASKDYGSSDLYNNILVLGELQRVLYKYGEAELAKKYEDEYRKYAEMFQPQQER